MLTVLLTIALVIFFILTILFMVLFFTKSCPVCPPPPVCPTCPACPAATCIPDNVPITSPNPIPYNYAGYNSFKTLSNVCTPLLSSQTTTPTLNWPLALTNNTSYNVNLYSMRIYGSTDCSGPSTIWSATSSMPPSNGIVYLFNVPNQVVFEITWYDPTSQNTYAMDININGTLVTQPNARYTSVNYTSSQALEGTIDIGSDGSPVANLSTIY